MATDPSQQLSQQLSKQLQQQGMPKPSSMVSFTEDEIAKSGNRIDGDREHVSALLQRTSGISIGYMGATGYGLNNSHDTMRDQKTDTYNVARQVLKSWYDAFQVADARYVEAEDANKRTADGVNGGGLPNMSPAGLGGLGGGGLPGGGLPGGGLPGGGLPGGGLPGGVPGADPSDLKPPGMGGMPDATDPRLKDPGLGTPDLKQPDPNNPDLKTPDLKQPDLKTPDLQQPDLKNPDLQQPDLKQPDLRSPELNMPDLDQKGLDPSKTSLADYQPSVPSVPSVPNTQLPGGGLTDPGRATVGYGTPGNGYTGIGTGGGLGTGTGGIGAGGAGVNNIARALSGAGAGGMPMMPMMPGGGMAGGRAEEKEKSDSTAALREDETVWEGDEDIAPAVLNHEDV
ncbi:hypothetical protein JYK22_31380, partial [Nonomuraea sp. RK-328]|nr:hypothetical protein [Nonomuraea sp. RK-328]